MPELPTTLFTEDTLEEMSYQWTRVTLNQILSQVQAPVALVVTSVIPVSTTPSHGSRGRRKQQRGEGGSSAPMVTILDLEDFPTMRVNAPIQT